MFARNAKGRQSAAVALMLLPLAGVVHGCMSPTAPPTAPAGGQTLLLDYDQFAATVEPVLMRNGCDADGDCHGGGIRGTLELSPATAKDVRYDFDQVCFQVTAAPRDSSLILRKPLALVAGGLPHAGVKPFATTADSDYQAIRAWVQAGVLR